MSLVKGDSVAASFGGSVAQADQLGQKSAVAWYCVGFIHLNWVNSASVCAILTCKHCSVYSRSYVVAGIWNQQWATSPWFRLSGRKSRCWRLETERLIRMLLPLFTFNHFLSFCSWFRLPSEKWGGSFGKGVDCLVKNRGRSFDLYLEQNSLSYFLLDTNCTYQVRDRSHCV